VRAAGYSPLGVSFDAVTAGTTTRLRMLADMDGDGTVGTATETGETVSWEFVGPDGDGKYELWRGVDIDGDWDFTDTDDSFELVAYEVVPIDTDGDGTDESFLSYDAAAPDTTRIRVVFGVQSQHRDALKRTFDVANYDTEIALRNRMLN